MEATVGFIEWVIKNIKFLRDILVLLVAFIIFRAVYNRIADRSGQSHGTTYTEQGHGSYAQYQTQEDIHQQQYHDSDTERYQNELYGTGEHIMDGYHNDEPLDFNDPNHYPIIDSYDDNINESNQTQPW